MLRSFLGESFGFDRRSNHTTRTSDWSDYDPDKEVDLRRVIRAWTLRTKNPPSQSNKIWSLEQRGHGGYGRSLRCLGDHYSVYGFSGYGRDCVRIFVVKKWTTTPSSNLAQHRSYAAPRINSNGSSDTPQQPKTDGLGSRDESTDCDQRRFSSRQRLWPGKSRRYGVEDTAEALSEAQQGIETFCITVDKSGHDT